MQRLTKIVFCSCAALCLGAGSVSAYLQAQSEEHFSDLTLDNIEVLAEVENVGGENVWHVIPLDDYGSKRCDRGGTAFCTF